MLKLEEVSGADPIPLFIEPGLVPVLAGLALMGETPPLEVEKEELLPPGDVMLPLFGGIVPAPPPPPNVLLPPFSGEGSGVRPVPIEGENPLVLSAMFVPAEPSELVEDFGRCIRPMPASAFPPAYGVLVFCFRLLHPVNNMPRLHAPIRLSKGILPIEISSPM